MSQGAVHTILLAQFSEKENSRQYSDFEDIGKAMDAVCRMYEQKLKLLNPEKKKITYDIQDLFQFVETLPDMSCLTFSPDISAYIPHNKEWIKQRVFAHLKKQAGQ